MTQTKKHYLKHFVHQTQLEGCCVHYVGDRN